MATKKDSSRGGLQSILVGIVIAAAMFAGYYMLSYTPTNKKIESTRVKVAAKEKALLTVRTQAPLLKPMTEKVKLLEELLEVYRAKIADKGEVISLIKTIEGEAQRLGLKVINIRTRTVAPPQPADNSSGGKDALPVTPPAYAKVVLDSNVQAGYFKLAEFLGTLQNLESFIVIESMDVAMTGETDTELALNLQMSLYSKKGVDNSYVAKK
jgi:Tfp pilus assembly protein PilO